MSIDFKMLIPSEEIRGEDEAETSELREMLNEATRYLSSFSWCKRIEESYFGCGVGAVFAVFLFKIRPSSDKVDEWIWVIVGDLPPAYITTEDAPNAACALDAYIGAMTKWVEAAKNGRTVAGLIPVNVPPTPENAAQLQSRLDFLNKEILSRYPGSLRGNAAADGGN